MGHDERPPYCWMLIGAPRSGTALHVDPDATAAWNTLVTGCKRWFIFSPQMFSEHSHSSYNNNNNNNDDYNCVIAAKEGKHSSTVVSDSAIHWLFQQYHTMPELSMSDLCHPQQQQLPWRCFDFVQRPGETVYIPPGWRHAVLNVEFSVAVTHNFVGSHNVAASLESLRHEDPRAAHQWHQTLQRQGVVHSLTP